MLWPSDVSSDALYPLAVDLEIFRRPFVSGICRGSGHFIADVSRSRDLLRSRHSLRGAALLGRVWGGSGVETADGTSVNEEPLHRGVDANQADLQAMGLHVVGRSSCTAILVAPREAMLAAHCVFPLGFGCDASLAPPNNDARMVRFPNVSGEATDFAPRQDIRVFVYAEHQLLYGDRVEGCLGAEKSVRGSGQISR